MNIRQINITAEQPPIDLYIGRVAENEVTGVEFDLTPWIQTYGEGTATIVMKRWGDTDPYPIALEIDENGKAVWMFSAADLAKPGYAYAQLSFETATEKRKKSPIYTLKIGKSLIATGEQPDPYDSWLEALQHLAAKAMAEALDIEGIVTDDTLSIEGGIADAKATGDALALKADKSTTYTKTEVDQKIEDVEVETDTTLAIAGAPADAKKVGDELSDIKAELDELEINTDSTLYGFIQGSISASGSSVSSDKHCRLYYQQFPSGLYSFTALNGYKMLCNDYGTNKVFSANIFNDVSEISGLTFLPDHYYCFCVWKADGTDLLVSSLPEDVITCTKTDFADATLTLAGKAADAKETGDAVQNISAFFGGILSSKFSSSEFETGKYATTTARSGSSAVSISISPDDTSGTARLGIRSKQSLDNGFVSNIDRLVSTGSIYMYVVGVDRNTGNCLGYYYAGAWRTSAKPVYAQQDINIAALIDVEPNLSVKLCIVDVSTEAQITPTDEVLSNITIYFSPIRRKINEYEEHFGSIDIALAKLPEYYNSNGYFDGKIASIKENMCAVGKHGFTFAFLTDLHWQINNRKSPVLLKNIMDRVSVNNVICGGDLIGQGTKEEAIDLLSACINAFRFYGITFPVTYGNHDGNWNTYNGQREHPERKLSFNEIYALMEAQYDKYSPVYYTSEGFNFYIDYPNTNTRVIFIDTGDTRELDGNSGIFWRDYETFADLLMNSGDKNIIVVPHAVGINYNGARMCSISNSYNARRQHSESYLTYDFTNAQGHVYLVIGGHGHQDIITTPEEGGISWVMTDTDSTATNTGLDTTAGTVNEQSFDVVTVDYSTGNVYLVRIGRGSDRSIPQN